MVSVEDAVIAKLSKGDLSFEILVDPEKAHELKKGKTLPVNEILAVQDIFKDAKKGERASADDLHKNFGTTDIFSIAQQIITHGEIQLTTEQRRRLSEEKRRQIADIISKHGINPQNKLPHPVQRILNAMEEARVNIDPFRPAKDQVEGVLSKIQSVLPIAFERLEIAVRIPMEYAGKASSVIRTIAPVKKEEWKSDAWVALIEIPAGMQSDIYAKLNNLTSGRAEVKVVKEKQI